MTKPSPLLTLPIIGAVLVGSPSVAGPAGAQVDYRGLVYARTSGNTCREANPTSNGLTYTKTGVKNTSGATATVWCPVVRRNSTPVGRVEKADSSLAESFIPTARIDQLSVDVRFTPQITPTPCTAYGRLVGTMGGVFFSSTRFTCGKNLSDCAGGEKTQTLTWRDPFRGSRPLANMGFRCDLRNNAGIIGSVASFAGDFVPAPAPAPAPVPVPAPAPAPEPVPLAGAFPQHWVLQDAGANCRRASKPGALRYFGDSVANDQGSNVVVLCPVNLAGQFDGFESSPPGKQVVFHHATVPVAHSTITVVNADPARSVSCTAVAAASNGGTWMSRTVGVAGSTLPIPGSTVLTQKINLAPGGNWGGQLGVARRQFPIRSLSYMCTLPPGTGVQRYVTAVCQNNADCHAGDDAGGDVSFHGQPSLSARVQHNGTECVPHDSHNAAATGSLIYSEGGIRLSAALDPNDFTQVACPLGAATGDSQMAPGILTRVEVFVAGPQASAPPCRVLTLDQRNTEADFIGAEQFKFDAAKGAWIWSGKRKADRRDPDEGSPSLYLNCFLAPGAGIVGSVTTQDIGGPAVGTPKRPAQSPTSAEASW